MKRLPGYLPYTSDDDEPMSPEFHTPSRASPSHHDSPPHSPSSSTSTPSKYLQRFASMPSVKQPQQQAPPTPSSPKQLQPSPVSPKGRSRFHLLPSSQSSLFQRRQHTQSVPTSPLSTRHSEDLEEEDAELGVELHSPPSSLVIPPRSLPGNNASLSPKRIHSFLWRLSPLPSANHHDTDPCSPGDSSPATSSEQRPTGGPLAPLASSPSVITDLHQLLSTSRPARQGVPRHRRCPLPQRPPSHVFTAEEEPAGSGGSSDFPRTHSSSTSSTSTKRLQRLPSRSVSAQHEEEHRSGSAGTESNAAADVDWPKSSSSTTDVSSIPLPHLPSRTHSSVYRADGESFRLDDCPRSDSISSHGSGSSSASLHCDFSPILAKGPHAGSFRCAHGHIVHVPCTLAAEEVASPSGHCQVEEQEEFDFFRTTSERSVQRSGSPLSLGRQKSKRGLERADSSTPSEPDMFWGTTFAAKRGLPLAHSPTSPDRPHVTASRSAVFRVPSDCDSDEEHSAIPGP